MNKFLIAVVNISMLSNMAINAGFNPDTMVNTPYGPKAIGALAAGDKVICMNKRFEPKEKTVKTVEDTEIDTIVEITTYNGTVLQVSPNQQMYIATKRIWVPAHELALGDILITQDKKPVRVKSIRLIENKTKLRFITVDKHENFIAGKEGIVSHNGLAGANICFWGAKFSVYLVCHGSIALVAGGVGLVSGPAGMVVGQALESTCAVPIEAASNYVGLCASWWGAVATGPI